MGIALLESYPVAEYLCENEWRDGESWIYIPLAEAQSSISRAKCWNMVEIISNSTAWTSLGQRYYATHATPILFASPVDVPSHRRWSYAPRRPGYCILSWMTDWTVDGCRRLGWGDKRHHKYRWTLHSRSSLCKSRSYMNLVLNCWHVWPGNNISNGVHLNWIVVSLMP